MADSTTGPPPGKQWLSRAGRWWAAGLTFVVGLLVGGLLVGLLSGGSTTSGGAGDEVPAVDAPATDAPDGADATGGAEPTGATGEVAVNASCLRTINAAQDVFEAVQGLGEALTELDARRLDEIVRELQPLQRRLETDLEDCDVAAEITDEDSGSAAASPTPEESPGD